MMAPPNVIIVHGAFGHPEENWFGWLRRELERLSIPCAVPALPTPEEQSLASWLQRFDETCGQFIHSNTMLVGHSLGAAFVLRWLESAPFRLRASFLAGAFMGKVGVEKFDDINASFFASPFDWESIRRYCRDFYCYHGDNDMYVSQANFDAISTALDAKKVIISNGGHLNSAAGYDRFPLILQHIKEHIQDAQHD
jgi:predicted alpha/beta hydrolase family esterase